VLFCQVSLQMREQVAKAAACAPKRYAIMLQMKLLLFDRLPAYFSRDYRGKFGQGEVRIIFVYPGKKIVSKRGKVVQFLDAAHEQNPCGFACPMHAAIGGQRLLRIR
jgi:hypothetical protein